MVRCAKVQVCHALPAGDVVRDGIADSGLVPDCRWWCGAGAPLVPRVVQCCRCECKGMLDLSNANGLIGGV